MVSTPSNEQFIQLMKQRRTTYTLSPETTIPDSELQNILENVLEEAPSTFGSFTTRLLVLVKEEHYKLWDIIIETLKGIAPPEQFESGTKRRLDGFRNAYGTILFFEDPENTRKLQDQYPFIEDKFPEWSRHTSAIHQYMIWTALTNAGLGANLQHYNPLSRRACAGRLESA
ncbi:MAG: hypothetical protein MMC23_003691 [Stictis urceolatum]|nr:hypothetical protein [Stictis urceolata]